ncbi:MAG: ATP-binding protein [Panacagrimonas sp.]
MNKLSTSAKLILFNSAILALGFAVLLATMIWLADRFGADHVIENLDAEVHILESDFVVDGHEGIVSLIGLRVQAERADPHQMYRLEGPGGETLAGNLAVWPQIAAAAGVDFRMPNPIRADSTEVLARWIRLSDGSRLLVGFDQHEVQQMRDALSRAALWSSGVILLVSLAAGLLLTRAALRPVEAIRESALRIMGGDLRHRIPIRGSGDEFDRLGSALNAMLDRIGQLIASVKGATDNIAHDLRSPLTRHRARLEAALRERPSVDELPAWIERNLADIDQVLATFQSLLRIATVESGLLKAQFAPCDIGELVRDAVDFVEPLAEEKSQHLLIEIEPGLSLQGHRDLLFQALVNLLDNAIKYGPQAGEVRVLARRFRGDVVIEILDRGPGIPEAERERVFERLYRLDHSRNTAGLGLGLSLVQVIAQLHNGHVRLTDNAPGTRVLLQLGEGAAAS